MGEFGSGALFQTPGQRRPIMEDPNSKNLASDSESAALFNSIFNDSVKPAAAVMSDGRLAMRMPTNWQLVENGHLPMGTSSMGCRPKDNPQVELNIFYGGPSFDMDAARKFHELLEKPPHLLSSAELKAVGDTLGNKADHQYFKILSAKTEELNGRTVLSIEGNYTQWPISAQVKYVDSGHDGSSVRAVSYTAPTKDYAKYLLQANKSFKSLIGR
jgi:hypothetical protein